MPKGRPTKKVVNLKRFTEQWQDFVDETQDLNEFGSEDACYVESALHWDTGTMEGYGDMANALELQDA